MYSFFKRELSAWIIIRAKSLCQYQSGTSSTTAGFDDWLGKGATDNKVYFGMKDGTAGNFVSTSGDIVIATEFAGKNGYVYVIRTNNYVDINSTYGAGAYFPEQMEFSIPGGIKPYEIVGAYKKQGGKIIGDFIPNPNFGGN